MVVLPCCSSFKSCNMNLVVHVNYRKSQDLYFSTGKFRSGGSGHGGRGATTTSTSSRVAPTVARARAIASKSSAAADAARDCGVPRFLSGPTAVQHPLILRCRMSTAELSSFP